MLPAVLHTFICDSSLWDVAIAQDPDFRFLPAMLGYLIQRFSGKSSEDNNHGHSRLEQGVSRSPSSKGWAKVGLRPRASPTTGSAAPPVEQVRWQGPSQPYAPNVSWLQGDYEAPSTAAEPDSSKWKWPPPNVNHDSQLNYDPGKLNAFPYISPSPSTSTIKSSSAATSAHKWGLRLQTDPSLVGSSQSLSLDLQQTSLSEDIQDTPYYPPVKQLSPIAEQDYFSPASSKPTPLPAASDHDANTSTPRSQGNRSPNGSQYSTVTKPSPVYAPFISRPLNRTLSQNSSRTHISTTSTTGKEPILPPLDLKPHFPGPHASSSYNASAPTLRPPKSATTPTMPTIAGSAEDYGGSTSANGSRYSLHADSFVTATDSTNDHTSDDRLKGDVLRAPAMDMDITEVPTSEGHHHVASRPSSLYENPFQGEQRNQRPTRAPSVSGSVARSPTESAFIHNRWDREASLGTGTVSFPRVKKQRFSYTPACWMFWLCFFCPPLWFVGGWYITIFAEAYTFRDPEDDWHWWGVRKQEARKRKRNIRQLQLPQWMMEKQQVSDAASSTRRALRGISYLYPFVARPIDPPLPRSVAMRAIRRVLSTLGKANRLLDKIPYVKLVDVDGEVETERRMFDPWIQRCRYAWCWFFILWCCVGVPALFIIRQYCSTCLRDSI